MAQEAVEQMPSSQVATVEKKSKKSKNQIPSRFLKKLWSKVRLFCHEQHAMNSPWPAISKGGAFSGELDVEPAKPARPPLKRRYDSISDFEERHVGNKMPH